MDRSQTWIVRGVIGLAVGLTLLIAQVTVILVSVSSDRHARVIATASGALPAPLPTTVADPTSPTANPSPTPSSSPAPTSVSGGAGIDSPGIYVEYTPRSGGGFDAVERIMVETTGTEIVFTPPAPGGGGAEFAGIRPVVSGLTVDVGVRRLLGAVPGRLDREIARPLLTGTARSVVAIHYRVTGTTAASTTDTERSLLRPLLAASDPGSKVQVHVAGGLGVAITCPQLPAVSQSCGRGSPPSLEAGPLTAASSTMVLVTSRG